MLDVKTLCLGVLARGEASGYEIRKEFESGAFSHFCMAGYGSIYPALGRLAEEGLVTCRALEQDKRPDKKLYALTQDGCKALTRALMALPEEDRFRSDRLFTLFLAERLPVEQVERILEAAIKHFEQQITHVETFIASETCPCAKGEPGHDFVHGFGLAYYRAARDYFRQEGDALLARLRQRQGEAAD